jgi:hypothetical protein
MNYYIQRQSQEYGPYTLADLQSYVAQGSILLTDLARSEGMTDWAPVAQVIGNIPVPVPGHSPVYSYGGAVGYAVPAGSSPITSMFPAPPDFHWALVLLLAFVTCGLFLWAWLIVEAAWVKKIKPGSKALTMAIVAVSSYVVKWVVDATMALLSPTHPFPIGILFYISYIGFYLVAVFMMSSDLEDHYNSAEPINLRLNGAMVFFFAVFYFQHHFSRIAQWKKNGVLVPQV